MDSFSVVELLKLMNIFKTVGDNSSPLLTYLRVQDTWTKAEHDEYIGTLKDIPFTREQIKRLRPLLHLRENRPLGRHKLVKMLPHIKFFFGSLPTCIKSSIIIHREYLTKKKFRVVRRYMRRANVHDYQYFIEEMKNVLVYYDNELVSGNSMQHIARSTAIAQELAYAEPELYDDLSSRQRTRIEFVRG